MPLSIFDIDDEYKSLRKMIADKKVKSDVVLSAKKQLYEHIDLKYNEYVASIAKIGREVNKKIEETKEFADNSKEVLLYFQKKLEYQTKLTANETAKALGKPIPFSDLHMNTLLQSVLELEKRQKKMLEGKVDIEALSIQMERTNWLFTAINKVKNFKKVLRCSNKKDKLYFGSYKVLQAASFVLSFYGVFYLVEKMKERVQINEFLLNLIAGIFIVLFVESITDSIKETVFENYLETSSSAFAKVISEMKSVDKALLDYTF